MDAKERLRLYRKFLYEAGAINAGGKKKGIEQKTLKKERRKSYQLTRKDRFLHRTRYFTDSGIIGSKDFVRQQYLRAKDLFQSANEKKPKPISGLKGLYSLKRLTE